MNLYRAMRPSQRGQSIIETVIAIGISPVIVIMLSAIVFFGQTSGIKVRLKNFARYAAIKAARGEPVDRNAALHPNNRLQPSFRVSRQTLPNAIFSLANGGIFLIAPTENSEYGNYNGQVFFTPAINAATLTIGDAPYVLRATTSVQAPALLGFGTVPLSASAGIDAQTWRSPDNLWLFAWRTSFVGIPNPFIFLGLGADNANRSSDTPSEGPADFGYARISTTGDTEFSTLQSPWAWPTFGPVYAQGFVEVFNALVP